ncbi:probable WRKY transcription factor 3 [Magnolia sinica]|uniref:probable WRKY transcription factor 3 n=1 Tax=Magnolia sinica TaxID=86752 RepID=UPI0026583975|nr:probable WRKY transcription factor 3 [Magnolia sinica]
MAQNEGAPKNAGPRPTIALPPRSSVENLFMRGPDASPGPMTLVSSFFAENDPDSDCRSFSQLLAGAMASPRPAFDSSSTMGDSSGGLRFKQSRPMGLVVAQSPLFTVPPGLSPASLLDSPGLFSSGQGHFGISHQQALAQVTAQAAQSQSHMHVHAEYASSLSAPTETSLACPTRPTVNANRLQQMPSLTSDAVTTTSEQLEVSHSDQRSQPLSLTVDKPADDGYNWRKYGQKQVKGSEYPRSYYKCTHPSCPVKKKVERSLDGQVTEIIYKGQHNHQRPQPTKRSKEGPSGSAELNGKIDMLGNPEAGSHSLTGNLSKSNEVIAATGSRRDQDSGLATSEQLSGSSDAEDGGDAEVRMDERDDDEPDPKRRNVDMGVTESVNSHRAVTEPRIIVQTTSEVDLLDDGYRWRKYGQKVVKGNPNPRSYYKCTNAGCNVRKHVERASTDPKAVITTYEGKHNHDVPAAKNSSHNTANSSASANSVQLKPHNAIADKHASVQTIDFRNNDQRPASVLRLKDEKDLP